MKILECRRFSTTYPLSANIRVVKDYEIDLEMGAEVCRKKYTSIKAGESACNQVYQYIKDNLKENISLESLAALVHLNKNHLVRLFKASYGKPPITMLIAWSMPVIW